MNDTQGVVLGFLGTGPHTGGEICRRAEAELAEFSITRSQVYRELSALADSGQIKAARLTGPGGRRNYRITAAGRKALKRWLASEGKVLIRNGELVREHFRQLSV